MHYNANDFVYFGRSYTTVCTLLIEEYIFIKLSENARFVKLIGLFKLFETISACYGAIHKLRTPKI